MFVHSVLLEVKDLRVGFPRRDGWDEVVRGVSLSVDRGEVVGLVGESGSGKTITALSILGLLPAGAKRTNGEVRLDGLDLAALEERRLRAYRGARIAFVFQEPEAALNPVFSVGYLLSETIRQHRPSLNRKEVREEAVRLLELVAIPDAAKQLAAYPHQFSGGQRQRITIALALAGSPDILIADEPTTALDVSLQAQILGLLLELRRSQGLALLLITHDLSVVASTCERAFVMYAGQIVESGTAQQIFDDPCHPYTRGLIEAVPRLGRHVERGHLVSIPGKMPAIEQRPHGCAFHPRCSLAVPECSQEDVELLVDDHGRETRCLLATGKHS